MLSDIRRKRSSIFPTAHELSNWLNEYLEGGPYLNTLDFEERKPFLDSYDPVRYGSIWLALKRIEKENILGAIAEGGVFQGETSCFLNRMCQSRKIYLFDTFEGFPERDLGGTIDTRFKDTNVESIRERLIAPHMVEFRKGYFPDTARGLESERFSFVMLDFDIYSPTKAGLEFFYPRLSEGGYIFVHDYNSPESNYAVSKAVDEFMVDRPEDITELPDRFGSVIIRKNSVRNRL